MAESETLSNITAEDVLAFVDSLRAQDTPWAIGCAAVMTSIWSDISLQSARVAELERDLAAAQEDAERYRFWREDMAGRKWRHITGVSIPEGRDDDDIATPDEIDAAIAAAQSGEAG